MSRVLAAALLLAAGAAQGHVVVQQPSLRQLLQASEAVAVVEFVSSVRIWEAPDGSDRQEYFTVRTVEGVAGERLPERFDVFPHAEGMPDFAEGDQALLFVERTASHPEFVKLAARFPYFTLQRAGQEWKVSGPGRAAIRSAAAAYRKLQSIPARESQAALRRLLLENLRSGSAPLREDAVGELLRARSLPGFLDDPKDAAEFTSLVARSSGLPVTTRVALARILDGAGGFAGDAAIGSITQEPLGESERIELIRAASAARDPAVTGWLVGLLASPDPVVRREAAYALGRPWHAGCAEALAGALGDPDPSVARAALRSLGGLGTVEAGTTLQRVAQTRPDFLGDLARAELRRLASAAAPQGTAPSSP